MCIKHRSTSICQQMLTSMKGEINSNTIIVGDFNTPLTSIDRSTKQKISKETQTLNDTKTRPIYIEVGLDKRLTLLLGTHTN